MSFEKSHAAKMRQCDEALAKAFADLQKIRAILALGSAKK